VEYRYYCVKAWRQQTACKNEPRKKKDFAALSFWQNSSETCCVSGFDPALRRHKLVVWCLDAAPGNE
jgi:hypothetical protein